MLGQTCVAKGLEYALSVFICHCQLPVYFKPLISLRFKLLTTYSAYSMLVPELISYRV